MKKNILILIAGLLLFIAGPVLAQDARNRTPQTVVSDVLARIPAQNAADALTDAADLAASSPETVTILSGYLTDPAVKSKAEYALSSLASYASSHKEAAAKVKDGFKKALGAASDKVTKDFLLRQLITPADKSDAGFFASAASDPDLVATAIGALVNLGAKDEIMTLIEQDAAPITLLAPAAADLGLSEAINPLLSRDINSLSKDEISAICKTIGEVGNSPVWLDFLKEYSPEDEVVMISRMYPAIAAKEARKLLAGDDSHIRCAAADVLLNNVQDQNVPKELLKILASDDRPLRNSALASATKRLGAGKLLPSILKKYSKLPSDAHTDILNWVGANKLEDALPTVLKEFSSAGETGDAAIRAATLIGGNDAISALVDALSTDKADAAMAGLLSVKGDVAGAVTSALKTAGGSQAGYLAQIAGKRLIKDAAGDVVRLCNDPVAAKAASGALAGVVSEKDIPAIAALIDKGKGDMNDYDKALISAISKMDKGAALDKVKSLMTASPNASNYDPVVASIATPEALELLRTRANAGDKDAENCLLMVDSPLVLKDVKAAAVNSDKYLNRYVNLLSKYETNPNALRLGYADAISMAKSPKVKSAIVKKVGDIPTMKAFLLAASNLDDKDQGVRYAAAQAVKIIASKTDEEINYDDFKSGLEKAKTIFKAAGGADDGYAVDEIDKMIREAAPSPKSVLTAEEKRRGFEMLFDGTDLSKWHGDKEGYTTVNGTIYVSANFGATGNLYTNKQYRNFIYRFEFCFLESGVNNGVGIRTPEGVDAAYDAMCEVQILDHDAPIYAGLQPYQVHGSVYGVIPAKRVVHKPLGEWSTEEIIVKGDNIKVTVNGEVIVDDNIRKAVKGHNVAPDGSNNNPYTVDHRNHPGMFNPRGYISFCGHGAGLKIRNVRILELPD